MEAFDPIIETKLPTCVPQILDGGLRATVAQIPNAERIFVALPQKRSPLCSTPPLI